jgi:hypothetical protein
MNRAFYGINAKMTTNDGMHTNAIYGFVKISTFETCKK